MRNTSTAVGAAFLLATALSGCSTGIDTADTAAPGSSAQSSSPASVPDEAAGLLAQFGLEGMDTVKIIDHLDRLGVADRPADLRASVRPSELLVSAGTEEFSLDIPDNLFYLSVAPYVDDTHECFHHSLTTCKGELGSAEIRVRMVDANGKVLVDEAATTFENGFIGYWLPRDITGTVQVTYDGKVGAVDFATDEEAPTCVSTLRLV